VGALITNDCQPDTSRRARGQCVARFACLLPGLYVNYNTWQQCSQWCRNVFESGELMSGTKRRKVCLSFPATFFDLRSTSAISRDGQYSLVGLLSAVFFSTHGVARP